MGKVKVGRSPRDTSTILRQTEGSYALNIRMAQNETYLVKILVCGSTGALRSFICNGILGEPLLDETKKILTVTTWKDGRNGMALKSQVSPLLMMFFILQGSTKMKYAQY